MPQNGSVYASAEPRNPDFVGNEMLVQTVRFGEQMKLQTVSAACFSVAFKVLSSDRHRSAMTIICVARNFLRGGTREHQPGVITAQKHMTP